MNHAMPCGSECGPSDPEEVARFVAASERIIADRGWLARMWLKPKGEGHEK